MSSLKGQRVSEAIGSIGVSTDAEQRQEYADINAEPRVSLMSLKLTRIDSLFICIRSIARPHERTASAAFQLLF